MGICMSMINGNGGRGKPPTSTSTNNATRNNDVSNVPTDDDGPSNEELEREAAAKIYAEKEVLLEKAKTAFKDGGHRGPGNILEQLQDEAGKQEADIQKLTDAAMRQQKLRRRREAKRKAELEQKWMVFSNLDAFDEEEMTTLADFMEKVVKKVPKLGDSQWTDKEALGEDAEGGMNVIEEYLALKAESTVQLKRWESMDNLQQGTTESSGGGDVRGCCLLLWCAVCCCSCCAVAARGALVVARLSTSPLPVLVSSEYLVPHTHCSPVHSFTLYSFHPAHYTVLPTPCSPHLTLYPEPCRQLLRNLPPSLLAKAACRWSAPPRAARGTRVGSVSARVD